MRDVYLVCLDCRERREVLRGGDQGQLFDWAYLHLGHNVRMGDEESWWDGHDEEMWNKYSTHEPGSWRGDWGRG